MSKSYKPAKMEAFEKMCLFLPRVTADPTNEKYVTPDSLALRKHFGGNHKGGHLKSFSFSSTLVPIGLILLSSNYSEIFKQMLIFIALILR